MRMIACLLPTLLATAAHAAQPAPDFAELTRAEQAASDRGDVAAMRRHLCPGAMTLRPDGLLSGVERMLATMRPRDRPTERAWGEFRVVRNGPVAVVVAPTTVTGRWGKADMLLTNVWLERPDGPPCLMFHQRAAGGEAGAAATWDIAYRTSDTINREPNRWLMEAVKGRPPGAALDVAMGQGRNTVWLAQQGWRATGFDIAGEGMRLAREAAAEKGVRIETILASDKDFDFGRDRWDLIAFMYAGTRGFERRAFDALRPGGIVVAEAFGTGADPARAGDSVFHEPGGMRRDFEAAGFRVVRYEEPVDVADFGLQRVPLVRMVAMKPER